MQLFKKDFEKLFTENETRANIAQTHDWGKNYTIGGFFMLLSTITAKHPNSFVLLKPKSRDEQNHVRDWNVLNTAKKYDDILRIAEYYRSEGISNAVILSTSDELVVPPEESTKFFRVYYNLFTIAKVVVHLPLGG